MKLIVIAAFLAAGCSTARPLGPFTSLPPETPQECTTPPICPQNR